MPAFSGALPMHVSKSAGGYRFYAGLGKEEAKWAKQRYRTAEIRTAARLLRCLASGMAPLLAGFVNMQLKLAWLSACFRILQ